MFKLKDNILGNKKQSMQPVVIIHPETGDEIGNPEEIKTVTLNYCKKLLTNRKPKEQYREIVENKIRLHHERMKPDEDEEEERI